MTQISSDCFVSRRLACRPINKSDTHWITELNQDPDVMRYINGGQPLTKQQTRDSIMPRLLRFQGIVSPYRFWAIEKRSDGEVLGWYHLKPSWLNTPAAAEIGYRLFKHAWGQGFTTELTQRVLELCHQHWQISHICAQALANNIASVKVLEKSGLTKFAHFSYLSHILPALPAADRVGVIYRLEC